MFIRPSAEGAVSVVTSVMNWGLPLDVVRVAVVDHSISFVLSALTVCS